MSASLVGSEMCIRDRQRHDRRPRTSAPGLQARDSQRQDRFSVFRGTRSVSYTHLTLPTICSV
eukprot:10346753-Alexandrium_andersonii.AAC.1